MAREEYDRIMNKTRRHPIKAPGNTYLTRVRINNGSSHPAG
jgi:hypothetical protein